MENKRFNIRVYGLLIDEGKILVTDEFRLGIFMTKFPGGALEYGEGLIDCLKREFREELDTAVDIVSHFYTTDFFQPSTLLPFESQLINVYYLVRAEKPFRFMTTEKRFDFGEATDGAQCFRWIPLGDLSVEMVTFPIDRIIVNKILDDLGQKKL